MVEMVESKLAISIIIVLTFGWAAGVSTTANVAAANETLIAFGILKS
jgi:hypothetical protein